MRQLFTLSVSALLVLIHGSPAFAEEGPTPPSLCKSNEEIILTSVVRLLKREIVENSPEKIVSVCATTKNNYINQLIYRFGSERNVEIEILASQKNPAKIFDEYFGGAAGSIGIRFEKPPYSYEISEGMGNSSAVNVVAYKNKIELAWFQGCNWFGCPHSSDLSSIFFSIRKVMPGILKKSKPLHPA